MEEKNKIFKGISGAFVGALIGAIPWLLAYLIFDSVYSILSIIIVVAGFYGYKITKAKIDESLTKKLLICTFIVITISVFVVIPIIYLHNGEYPVNFEYYKLAYSIRDIRNIIIRNYIVALAFSAIVIYGINFSLKKQLEEGLEEKDIRILPKDASNKYYSNDDINKVKEIFKKNQAMDKKHAITKDLALEELLKEFQDAKAAQIFTYLKVQQIIKKEGGKYYFSEKAQNSSWYRYGLSNIKTFIIILVLATIFGVIIVFYQNRTGQDSSLVTEERVAESVYELGESEIKIDFPEDMVILSNTEIAYYFEIDYINQYECIAANNEIDKIISIFHINKETLEKEYELEDFVELFSEDETEEIDFTKSEIGKYEYIYFEQEYTTNSVKYISGICMIELDDTFYVIYLQEPEDERINVEDILVVE